MKLKNSTPNQVKQYEQQSDWNQHLSIWDIRDHIYSTLDFFTLISLRASNRFDRECIDQWLTASRLYLMIHSNPEVMSQFQSFCRVTGFNTRYKDAHTTEAAELYLTALPYQTFDLEYSTITRLNNLLRPSFDTSLQEKITSINEGVTVWDDLRHQADRPRADLLYTISDENMCESFYYCSDDEELEQKPLHASIEYPDLIHRDDNIATEGTSLGRIASGRRAEVFSTRYNDKYYVLKRPNGAGCSHLQLQREIDVLSHIQANTANSDQYVTSLVAFSKQYAVYRFHQSYNLKDLLEKKAHKVNENCRLEMIRHILEGLLLIHSLGVLHRDLKPDNIVINHNDRLPRICDFGLSSHNNRVDSIRLGAVYFLSPKLLEARVKSKKRIYTAKDEMYSFALLMYFTFTGELPFGPEPELYKKDVTQSFYERIASQHYRPKIPYYVAKSPARLIGRAWDHEESKRPSFKETKRMLQVKLKT